MVKILDRGRFLAFCKAVMRHPKTSELMVREVSHVIYGKLARGAVDIKKRTSIAIKPLIDQMVAILGAEQKPHPHPHSLQSGYTMIAHRSGPERRCGQTQLPRQVSPSGNRGPPASTASSQSTSLPSWGASSVNAWTLLTSYHQYIYHSAFCTYQWLCILYLMRPEGQNSCRTV